MTLEGFRPAAVLAPIVVRADELTLLLTERTSDLPSHAGQVAFPGGKIDATDHDAAACAVREAAEELGLDPAQSEVLGRLDDLPTPTGFVISPVVALVRAEPLLRPNPSEVASFFYAPLEALRDPSRFERLGERELLGFHYEVFAYRFEGHTIWGATARMVKQILELAYS